MKIKSTFFAIGGLALLMIAFPVNAQVFLGDSEDNLFQGSATGHDRFFGRRGEDLISYDGMITSYGFELRSSGRIRVHKSNGDFDVLDDIERVKFEGEVYELNEILSVIGFQTGVIIYHGTTGLDSFQGDTTGEACYYGDRRYDRVFYEGVSQQYSFTELADGTVSVIKPSGDVDILNSIEAVRFDEETQARDIEDLTAQATDVSEPTLEERQEVISTPLILDRNQVLVPPRNLEPTDETETAPHSDPSTEVDAGAVPVSSADPNQLFHYGQAVNLVGANLAWSNNARFSSDFGASDGFGNKDTNLIGFQVKFDEIARNGGNSARIWVHTTAQVSPNIQTNGRTVGLSRELTNEQVVDQMIEVLDSAWDRGILVTYSLFSFDMLCDAYQNDFGYTGTMVRNRRMIRSWRQDYFDNALTPIVRGLKDHPALFAYEIFNEPEGVYTGRQFCETEVPINQSSASIFVNEAAAVIHELDANVKVTTSTHTDLFNDFSNETLTSLENAKPEGVLDFYELHWYRGWGRDPYTTLKSDYNLDRPIIIGEFDLNESLGTSSNPSRDAISTILENGYAGAWPWSLATTDEPFAIGATINAAQQTPINKVAVETCIREQSPECYNQLN